MARASLRLFLSIFSSLFILTQVAYSQSSGDCLHNYCQGVFCMTDWPTEQEIVQAQQGAGEPNNGNNVTFRVYCRNTLPSCDSQGPCSNFAPLQPCCNDIDNIVNCFANNAVSICTALGGKTGFGNGNGMNSSSGPTQGGGSGSNAQPSAAAPTSSGVAAAMADKPLATALGALLAAVGAAMI